MTPDFYGELGVSPEADIHEIRRAYRRRAAENDPLTVTHLSDEQRQAAARTTERLLAAFKVLNDETTRLLYDQCLAKGYDFERVHTMVAAETEAEREAQAKEAREVLEDVVDETARGLEQAIVGLAPQLQWSAGELAEYFDVALEGSAPRQLVRVHLKILPTLEPETLGGVIRYAEQLLQVTEAVMTSVMDSYLLVSSTALEPEAVEELVLAFNAANWRDASARRPRAFVAYASAADERVRIPGVEDPLPDLRQLAL